MKILCNPGDYHCALFHIFSGWKNVFEFCGHEFVWWPEGAPALDVFNIVNPDIFIGTTYNLDTPTIKAIKQRPDMKVALRAFDWGEYTDTIDLKYYQIGAAQPNEIELTKRLRQEAQNQIVLFNHYHENYIHKTHKHWEQNGFPVVGIMLGADVFNYTNGKYSEQFASDLCIISSYHPSKALNIDKYIIPLCYPIGKYNIKIFSTWHWPVPQYCGSIPKEFNKTVLASAKICLQMSEPFSTDLGYDVIERPFYIFSNKCFCIADYVKSMQEDVFANGELPSAKTPEEYRDLIDYYLKNPLERDVLAKKGYNTVIQSHTYFHRIAQLFDVIGIPAMKQYTLTKYEEWKHASSNT